MKWIVLLVFPFLIGCATPRKPKPHHVHHHSTHKVSDSDDAATRALIKSLRDE